jgi:hypothetical protein
LLLSLKRRDDLLARVGTKVDAALRELERKTAAKPSKRPAPQPIPAPAVEARSAPVESHSVMAAAPGCPQCHKHIEPDSQFCWSCGASLAGVSVPGPATGAGTIPGSTSRRYACAADDIPRLINDVRGWLNTQGFDTQHMNTDSESVLLQVKKRGSWRDLVGMATSLNIVFHPGDDSLTVEIGAGKWIDKAAVGTVSLFLLWPLAITAGMGAWEQMKMPERIFDYIGSRLTCG